MKVIFFLVNMSVAFSMQAQLTVTPPKLMPPSPTAYSLGKYGDLPVSLYTGVPNVSIPLYDFKHHDISVNVSISYHGSGIKVDEVASTIGLGWSLNAGGVITRVPKGELEYLTNANTLYPQRSNIVFYDGSQTKADFISSHDFEATVNGGRDSEPDEFYYNFNGRSGKFWFDNSGNARLNKQEGLDIRWYYTGGYEQKFIIRDENGTSYEFSDLEITSYPGATGVRTSAWYLSKIISATGNEMLFEYYSTYYTDFTRSYSEYMHLIHPTNNNITGPAYNGLFLAMSHSELRVKKITCPSGNVEFKYNAHPRLDVPEFGSPALQEITLHNAAGICLKRYKLTTNYFEANNYYKYAGIDPASFTYLNYRLRLDALQEYDGKNVVANPPHIFTYLGDNSPATDDELTLPHRLSPAQDHWGYFNHVPNSHMVPGKATNDVIASGDWYAWFRIQDPESTNLTIGGGANRNPHSTAVLAGLLSKIQYPTGGYTELIFEANDFAANVGGARIKKLIDQPQTGLPKETEYIYNGAYGYDPSDYYFEYYVIGDGWPQGGGFPIPTVLQAFNLPAAPTNGDDKWVKIITQPQAILGQGSRGYSAVRVKQPGNGSTLHIYASLSEYPDYKERDVFTEETLPENNLLNDLYLSEYIDATTFPSPTGRVVTKTTGGLQRWPYPENYSNDWKRGVLTAKYIYNEANVLIKEEEFQYYRKLLSVLHAWKVKKFDWAGTPFIYTKYLLPNTWLQPKKTITKEYDQNGQNPLVATVEYFYDNMAHGQQTRIETTRSDGKKEIVATTYPLDYAAGTGFLDDMVASHLLAVPIEKVKYLDDGVAKSIISGSISKYKSGGKGLKDEELLFESASPTPAGSFKFSNRSLGTVPPAGTPTSFASSSNYKSKLKFHQYDPKGNLLHYSLNGNLGSTFIWDYFDQYPVAEITNASNGTCAYTSFESNGWGGWTMNPGSTIGTGGAITGTKSFSGVIYKTVPSGNYTVTLWMNTSGFATVNGQPGVAGMTKGIWQLRTWDLTNVTYVEVASASMDEVRLYPKGAHMSTYTYAPLVGMTSQADNNNKIRYFVYDILGRLQVIKDLDGNILKKYCYTYQGQIENCNLTLHENTDQSGNYYSQICAPGYSAAPYYVSVPAGSFFSSTSINEANSQAQASAQQQANQNGICQPPMVTINYYNSTSGSDYSVNLYNTSTGQTYQFGFNSYSSGSLGQVPAGNYNITIVSSSDYNNYRSFYAGCGYYNSGYGSAYFYGIPLNGTCNSIEVY